MHRRSSNSFRRRVFRASRLLAALAVLAVLAGFPAPAAESDDDGTPRILRNPEWGPPVTPYVFDGDVRDLPRPRTWQPGDPVRNVPIRHYAAQGIGAGTESRRDLEPLAGLELPNPVDLVSTVEPTATDGLTIGTFTVPTRNFPGIDFMGTLPDPVGDVGPQHYIQMTNFYNSELGSVVRIFDKAEPAPNELASFTLSDLAGGSCTGSGDPIVLYDRQADRWLLSEIGPCIYVSQTGDPVAGGWYVYSPTVPTFPDYPKYAVWATDANGGAGSYVLTTNETTAAGIYAFDRGAMLDGGSASFVRFTVDPLSAFVIQGPAPADPDGPLGPPAGEPAIVLRHRDTEIHAGATAAADLLDLWLLDVDWEQPKATTLTATAGIDVSEFDSTVCGVDFVGCFPQPNTTMTLSPLREPVMHRLQYYNHGDFETLTGNFTVDVDGRDHGGIRWFELRRPAGGAWSLRQEGTYAPDAHHRWMGSVAMDRAGDIALGYSVVSSSLYPALRYTGRLADDATGWMTEPETTIHSGSSSQVSYDRWGDYQAMSLDPSDDCTFWFTGMDMNANSTSRTQIVSFRSETCGCAEIPPMPPIEAEAVIDNRVDLYWDDSAEEGVVDYVVERSRLPGGPYEALSVVPDTSPGAAGGTGYSFQDDGVSGGITYYYVVLARDGQGCRSKPFNEVAVTATGACTLPPAFSGLETATSGLLETCSVSLSWSAAEPQCGGPVAYNVYRSETSGFTPGADTLLAGGVVETTFADAASLIAGSTYRYVVRAVDLANGAEDSNLVERSVTVWGPGKTVQSFLLEDFEAADSLSAWTIVNAPEHDCGDWKRDDSSLWTPSYEPGYYAISNSGDCRKKTFDVDTSLDSPAMDLTAPGIESVTLQVDALREGDDVGTATMEAWDGTDWRVVWTLRDGAYWGGSVEMTPYAAGNPAFRVRFRHRTTAKGSYLSVDNVRVTAAVEGTCTTAP